MRIVIWMLGTVSECLHDQRRRPRDLLSTSPQTHLRDMVRPRTATRPSEFQKVSGDFDCAPRINQCTAPEQNLNNIRLTKFGQRSRFAEVTG